MSRITRIPFVLLLSAVALSACGKRGHLEPPPGQQTAAEAKTGDAKAGDAKAGTEAGQTKLGGKKRVPITPPKRDLIIDGILE